MEEEKLTRREVIKGLSKLVGISIFIPSALIGMYGVLEDDFERAELIPRRDDYKVKGGLLGGAITFLLIYYGTRKDK